MIMMIDVDDDGGAWLHLIIIGNFDCNDIDDSDDDSHEGHGSQ